MTDHNVRTWAKFDGTWDVTHHQEKRDGYLHDVAKDFRNFPTREAAEAYAFSLFKSSLGNGNEYVELGCPDSMGQERKDGCWAFWSGDSFHIMVEKDQLKNCGGQVPEWIQKELKKVKWNGENRSKRVSSLKHQ